MEVVIRLKEFVLWLALAIHPRTAAPVVEAGLAPN
jgi:hypothetical protein